MEYKLDAGDVKFSGSALSEGNASQGVLQVRGDTRLDVHVSSDTDPAVLVVGLAGIASSIIIAFVTSRVQRNQTTASIANLRSNWLVDLRSVGSEFLQQCSRYLSLFRTGVPKNDPSYDECYQSALLFQIRMKLMLDKEGEVSRAIVDLSEECLVMLFNLSSRLESDAISDKMSQVEDLLKDELEAAWLDIKADFNLHKVPFFKRIKSLIWLK
nr:hypothetical protein [uncultured Pseudomonas sp.]